MIRGLWFELDETGKLILILTIITAILVCGLFEFINGRNK